jgi:tyrosyl-tRNA synthetase
MELGRRIDGKQLYALTSPLLTTSSGAKMGKTAAGAIWLNADMLSPYNYWQYWRNSEDADVGRFLKLYTELPLAEVARLAALGGSEINEAKKLLATEATAMLHGRTAAAAAAETARQTFEEGQSAEGLPTFNVTLPIGILQANVAIGFAKSNGEARKGIANSAIRVNDVKVTDEKMLLTDAHRDANGNIKISWGQKKHALIAPR